MERIRALAEAEVVEGMATSRSRVREILDVAREVM